jgi:hypothetical protein
VKKFDDKAKTKGEQRSAAWKGALGRADHDSRSIHAVVVPLPHENDIVLTCLQRAINIKNAVSVTYKCGRDEI